MGHVKGKRLSKEHRLNISRGLKRSEKHTRYHERRDVNGNKNPNWRPKYTYRCPVCQKRILLTKTQFRNYSAKGRTCSRSCAGTLTSKRLKGVKRPEVSKRMKENNPMKNPETAEKMSATLKESYASGKLDWLREKLAIISAENSRSRNQSIESRERASIRMKENNPMFDKKVAQKVSRAMRKKYKNGQLTPPKLTGSRFRRGYYQDKNGNEHHYDSGWELERMIFLDRFLTIIWKKNLGDIKVVYLYKGKRKTYYPDFIICRRGSNNILVEEIGDWHPSKAIKIQKARKYFSEKGIRYVVISKKSELQKKTWV